MHAAEITARIRGFWGLQRSGTRIQAAVEKGIAAAARNGAIGGQAEFWQLPGAIVPVRDRSAVSSAGLRKPEYLPPAEIRAAAVAFIGSNLGASLDETVTGVSRLFGFKATSSQLREVIVGELEAAVRDGALVKQEDLLSVRAA